MVKNSRTRTRAAAVLVLACGLALAGCTGGQAFTPTGQTVKGMTPVKSAQQVIDLFHATEAVAGTNRWWVSGNVFMGCGQQNTDNAPEYDMVRRVAITDAQAKQVVPQVQKIRVAHGIRTTLTRDNNIHPPSWVISDPPYLSGSNPDGSAYQFYGGKNMLRFSVQGRCGKGNILPKMDGPEWPISPALPPPGSAPPPPDTPAPAARRTP